MCSPTQVFDELYAAHYQQVFRRLYRLLGGPREEVEDLTQQTFLKAWCALPTLSHTGFLPWLYCIANRLAIDTIRQRALRHLPNHHRRALLYSACGYSLQEIMDLMQCSLVRRLV